MSDHLVDLDAIREAQERIRPVAVRTPLYRSDVLSRELGSDVRLKLESLQRTGSFKFRGAYNFVAQLPGDVRSRGVITYSSGNHAQAVALAAQLHDTRAVVVMPTTSPQIKRDGAERLGAEVVLEGTASLERMAKAESIAEEWGLVMVPPFDDLTIIAGQGTVGLEIAEDWDAFETVLVPIGGGGLCSGTAAALRRLRPDVRILGVEPRGGAAMKAALEAGEPVTLERSESVADGLLPVRTGDLTFEQERLVVEFSGVATVAALRGGEVEPEGGGCRGGRERRECGSSPPRGSLIGAESGSLIDAHTHPLRYRRYPHTGGAGQGRVPHGDVGDVRYRGSDRSSRFLR